LIEDKQKYIEKYMGRSKEKGESRKKHKNIRTEIERKPRWNVREVMKYCY
jgi:hypothetical protein